MPLGKRVPSDCSQIDFIMKKYRTLNKQIFHSGEFSLVPIRYEDRYKIMKWRNEQVYHLRQDEPLTKEKQDHYFQNVVAQLFDKKKPSQLLFSFLKKGELKGYGGLVRINWIDKNAEISFLMKTSEESENFSIYWYDYLDMIEEVAFTQLGLHKIYTFAFDLRPDLYIVLKEKSYFLDSILTEHVYFEGRFIDAVIHSKIIKKNQ